MKKYPFYQVDRSVYQTGKFVDLEHGISFEEWLQQINRTIFRKPLYNPFLAFLLTVDNIPATRHDEQGITKGVFTPGPVFHQSYADGFSRGEKDFYLIASHNNKVDIKEQYENIWSDYARKMPLRITFEIVEEYGYYAAHIDGVNKLGLIKPERPKSLTALQYAALLWYNGIKVLSSSSKYLEIKNLKEGYPFCKISEKKIFDHHRDWRNGDYRAGKGYNNQTRAYIGEVYSILEVFDLKDREDYYSDIEAFRRNAPKEKT